MIHADDWMTFLDNYLNYRKHIRKTTRIRIADEIKATDYVNRRGPFRALSISRDSRIKLLEGNIRIINKIAQNNKLRIKIFSIAINKNVIVKQDKDPKLIAWEYALQRVERYLTKNNEKGMIYSDEGYDANIIKLVRKMRRHSNIHARYGSGYFDRKCDMLVEDAVMKKSKESYFVQVADLVAYSAYRHINPISRIGNDLWGLFGDLMLSEVNSLRGGPRGIVTWPK